MRRLYVLVIALAIAETAWALLCAEADVNIFLFYGVLVAASALFWVPGLAEKPDAGQTNR